MALFIIVVGVPLTESFCSKMHSSAEKDEAHRFIAIRVLGSSIYQALVL